MANVAINTNVCYCQCMVNSTTGPIKNDVLGNVNVTFHSNINIIQFHVMFKYVFYIHTSCS